MSDGGSGDPPFPQCFPALAWPRLPLRSHFGGNWLQFSDGDCGKGSTCGRSGEHSGSGWRRRRRLQRAGSQQTAATTADGESGQAQIATGSLGTGTAPGPPFLEDYSGESSSHRGSGRQGVRLWTGSCSSLGKDIQRVLMCERERGWEREKGVNESPQGRLLTSLPQQLVIPH